MLPIMTPEHRQYRLSGIFIVNFEHTSHLFLEFTLLTLTRYMFFETDLKAFSLNISTFFSEKKNIF